MALETHRFKIFDKWPANPEQEVTVTESMAAQGLAMCPRCTSNDLLRFSKKGTPNTECGYCKYQFTVKVIPEALPDWFWEKGGMA